MTRKEIVTAMMTIPAIAENEEYMNFLNKELNALSRKYAAKPKPADNELISAVQEILENAECPLSATEIVATLLAQGHELVSTSKIVATVAKIDGATSVKEKKTNRYYIVAVEE